MRSSHSGLPEELGARIGMLPTGEPLVERLLFVRHRWRQYDLKIEKEITVSAGGRQTLVLEPELAFSLAACWHFHPHRFGEGRRHDLGTEGRFPWIDRQGHMNVASLAAKDGIWLDRDMEIQVSPLSAV